MDKALQKRLDKLTKAWDTAHAMWKKAAKKASEAAHKYGWDQADDGWKWKQALFLQKRNATALEKAEAAREKLVEFTRRMLKKK
jgi:hypothetical protein